jgi:hypothetical protein
MRLPRPYIPWSVRYQVVHRQCKDKFPSINIPFGDDGWGPQWSSRKLRTELLLVMLFSADGPYHLDHDPPLAFRKKIHNSRGEIIGYDPPANNPDFLIYRKATDHRIKTNIRGEGAQHCDRVLIKKIRRIEHPKPKRKYNWPKRKVRP